MKRIIISMLAHGDAVISASCINKMKANSLIKFVCGRNNARVLSALSDNLSIVQVDVHDPLSIFDLRKKGVWGPIKETFANRSEFSRVLGDACKIVYVEKPASRWHIVIPSGIGIKSPERELSNVYLDRLSFFEKQFQIKNKPDQIQEVARGVSGNYVHNESSKVLICPTARLKQKQISNAVIKNCIDSIAAIGCSPILVDWCGQYKIFSEDCAYVNNLEIEELFRLISSSHAMITADSMTGHVAEYYNIPVFVIFNVPNVYWAPLSSFLHRFYFVCENNSNSLSESIDSFFSGLESARCKISGNNIQVEPRNRVHQG